VALHGFPERAGADCSGGDAQSTVNSCSCGLAVRLDRHSGHPCRDNRVFASPPSLVQKATQSITDPIRTLLFGHEYPRSITHVRTSRHTSGLMAGRQKEESFLAMMRDNFASYSLEIGGLVETQLHLTLADLRAMPKQTQITKHICIQGWSGVAEWAGVPLHHTLGLCRPLPSARYIVFHAFDNKSTSEPHAQGPGVLLWHDSPGIGGRPADDSCL